MLILMRQRKNPFLRFGSALQKISTRGQNMTDQKDIFRNMHPVKAQIIRELEQKAKGKEMKNSAPLIMEAMQKLKAHNLSFSQEEVTVLLGILTKDMNEEEKQKVEMMKQVIKNKGKR